MRTLISEIAAVGLAVYCRPHEHQMQELKEDPSSNQKQE